MAENNETTSINPEDVLDLIPGEAIKHMLVGFSNQLKAGVALVYPEKQSPAPGELFHLQPDNTFMNKVCQTYRENSECDKKCADYDCLRAREYIVSSKTGPGMYQCHLGLLDMAYPLWAGGRVWGILFAGQAILAGDEHENVITTAINANTPPEHLHKVLQSFQTGKESKGFLSQTQLDERYENFKKFGVMMQSLVETAYKNFVGAKFRAFNAEINFSLTCKFSTESDWWEAVAESSRKFCDYTGIKNVRFLSLQGEQYEQKVTSDGVCDGDPVRTPLQMFTHLDNEKLVELTKLPKGIVTDLGLSIDTPGYVYKRYFIEESKLLVSTAIVLIGDIHGDIRDSVAEFCKMICLRAGMASLARRIEQDAKEVSLNMQKTYHNTKTPLQWIVDLQQDLGAFEDDEIENTKKQVIDYVFLVTAFLEYLHETPSSSRERFDFSEFTRKATMDCMPGAKKKKLVLDWSVPESDFFYIRADRIALRIVLDNLLANAIKYSWRTQDDAIRIISIEMTCELSRDKKRYGSYDVRLRIRNYGIGIPQELLDRLNAADEHYGDRAKIEDKLGEKRFGQGYGIAISKEILKSHGGRLRIASRPADYGFRKKDEEYHRYLTTVDVYLPISER
jgi:signal transduction histidine kinase/ligand-binding sensor protein